MSDNTIIVQTFKSKAPDVNYVKMFKKKIKCRCGKKVSTEFSYCPYCGAPLKEVKRLEDQHERELKAIEKSFDEAFKMPFFIKFPFKKLIRDIDKQFREMDREMGMRKIDKPANVQGVSIKVESGLDGQPVIKVKQFRPGETLKLKPIKGKPGKSVKPRKKEEIKLPTKKLTKAQQARIAKLPKEEPQTSVRRLTDKIIYEIILPGVKSDKDIVINKLQNSIEIKAFTKDKAYFKLIPVSFPIKNYYIEKDKLVLELKP